MADITSVNRFVRVFHAAFPHFIRLPEIVLSNIRTLYPKTSRALVQLATNIANETYGEQLLDRYRRFSPEESQLTFPEIKDLLTIETQKLPPDEQPEILNQPPPSLSEKICQSFLQLFEESIENLINLSHLTVKMLLAEKMEDQATDIALNLAQPTEKSKALLELILYRIHNDTIESGAALYPLLSSIPEKHSAATALIKAWLQKEQIEPAIIFSGNIEEESERNHALQEAALCMVKLGNIDEAIALIECFEDVDAKAYALSRLVNNLATIGDFKNSVAIAYSIQEKNYRQDAFHYILNKMISMRRLEDAIEVASFIPGMQERLQAAKMIERALHSYHQDSKIKRSIAIRPFHHIT